MYVTLPYYLIEHPNKVIPVEEKQITYNIENKQIKHNHLKHFTATANKIPL
jgi:hypothetical protein